MSKKVDSPVEKFPGHVILPEPLFLPDALEYEEMLKEVRGLEDATSLQIDAAVLPYLIRLVEEWHLEGIPESPTVETYPATPRVASAHVIGWLITELSKIYRGEQSDPNE